MCLFSTKTPSVAPLQTTARELVPEVQAKEPDSPEFGGENDSLSKRKGRDALKIKLGQAANSYKPTNI